MGQNQRRATKRVEGSDVIVIGVLWSALAVLIGISANAVLRDDDTGLAKLRAKTLALQLAEEQSGLLTQMSKSSAQPSMRGPASANGQQGAIGVDPWGRPFHFAVLGDSIAVWSAGRDGVVASSVSVAGEDSSGERDSAVTSDFARFDFRLLGDDVGVIVPRRQSSVTGPLHSN